MRIATKRIAGICVFTATAALCLTASSQAWAWSYSYAAGHAGIAAKYSGGELDMVLNVTGGCTDDAGNDLDPREYSSDEVYVRAPDATKTTRDPVTQSSSDWDFLGTDVGSDLWVMPQTQIAGKPYMGFTTGKLTDSDWLTGGTVTYSLVGIDGPGGNISTWTTSVGVPTAYWQSSDGCGVDDVLMLDLDENDHKHVNWGFTKAGVYNVDVQFSGTLVDGGPVSITKTFTFLVGSSTVVPEPGMLALLASGLATVGLMIWRKRRQRGV